MAPNRMVQPNPSEILGARTLLGAPGIATNGAETLQLERPVDLLPARAAAAMRGDPGGVSEGLEKLEEIAYGLAHHCFI